MRWSVINIESMKLFFYFIFPPLFHAALFSQIMAALAQDIDFYSQPFSPFFPLWLFKWEMNGVNMVNREQGRESLTHDGLNLNRQEGTLKVSEKVTQQLLKIKNFYWENLHNSLLVFHILCCQHCSLSTFLLDKQDSSNCPTLLWST